VADEAGMATHYVARELSGQMIDEVRPIPGKRIAFAHLLRGVAAGSVVLFHFAYLIWRRPDIIGQLIAFPGLDSLVDQVSFMPLPNFGLPLFWGHFGVALFFLVSGFVIPFSMSSLSRAGFAAGRVLRIWPTYLVGLAVAIICVGLNAILSGGAFPYTLGEVLTNALIMPRWPSLTRSIDGIIWSLEIEIFFYGFCIFVANWLRLLDPRVFLFSISAIPAAYAASVAKPQLIATNVFLFSLSHWASIMPTYVCFLLCGTAYYYNYRGRLSLVETLVIQGFLFLCFAISLRIGLLAVLDWSMAICYFLAYCIFALAYFGRERIAALPMWVAAPLGLLADISYPVYTVHGVLGYTLIGHLLASGAASGIAVGFAVCVVLAVAFVIHRIVEVPTHSLGRLAALSISTQNLKL
jgi:peptidoglycan/LPS O-acetylase OafA/YrhL